MVNRGVPGDELDAAVDDGPGQGRPPPGPTPPPPPPAVAGQQGVGQADDVRPARPPGRREPTRTASEGWPPRQSTGARRAWRRSWRSARRSGPIDTAVASPAADPRWMPGTILPADQGMSARLLRWEGQSVASLRTTTGWRPSPPTGPHVMPVWRVGGRPAVRSPADGARARPGRIEADHVTVTTDDARNPVVSTAAARVTIPGRSPCSSALPPAMNESTMGTGRRRLPGHRGDGTYAVTPDRVTRDLEDDFTGSRRGGGSLAAAGRDTAHIGDAGAAVIRP